MIKQLHISNYALIDRLDIGFDDGLTIITGETGAGKSIILGALSLILGERADTKSIRDMSSKTVVEATFDIAEYGLQRFFEEQDIDWDDHECLVRRELSPTGRSRAFVNDTPVALSVLRELATRLLDIHSQHSNMLLSQPAFQLSILDSIAGNAGLLDDYRKTYQEYRNALKQLDDTQRAIEQLRRNEDYIRFQLDQLHALQLQPDEDKLLEALQSKLSNVTELKEDLWSVENELNNEDNSILERLSAVAQRLENAEKNILDYELLSEEEYWDVVDSLPEENQQLPDDDPQKFIAMMGAEAIEYMLKRIDLDHLANQLRAQAGEEGSQQHQP